MLKKSSFLPPNIKAIIAQRRKLFVTSLLISLAINLLILAIAGWLVVFHHLFVEEAQFRSEEVVKRLKPRELEYKVRVQELQKKSGRPVLQPRISADGLSKLSLPDVKVEIVSVKDKISANVKTMGISGLGTGIGSGTGHGGLGLGTSEVNFFGIRDRSERIAFLVDVSLSMLEDERGGVWGYERLKQEIIRMINGLSEGTFFNIIIFATHVDTFLPKLKVATPEIKERAVQFLKPYNVYEKKGDEKRFGNLYKNYFPAPEVGLPARSGTTRIDMALTAAFEQGADTIFILTDGSPRIWKLLEGKEREDYEKRLARLTDRQKQKGKENAAKKRKERKKENAKRAKKGLPPKITEGGGGGGGGVPRPKWNHDDVLEHLKKLAENLYKDRKPPRVHVIGYETNAPDENFLKELASDYRGKFRRIRGFLKAMRKKRIEPAADDAAPN